MLGLDLLIKNAKRWSLIKHLEPSLRTELMNLSDEEFDLRIKTCQMVQLNK